MPGEVYEGTVVIYDSPENHRLHVWKVHIYPDCDFPLDPNDDDEDETDLGEHEMQIAA